MKSGITDAIIQVPLQVERWEAYDSVLALWGHIGDYEVCWHVPLLEYQTPLDLIQQLAEMEE